MAKVGCFGTDTNTRVISKEVFSAGLENCSSREEGILANLVKTRQKEKALFRLLRDRLLVFGNATNSKEFIDVE